MTISRLVRWVIYLLLRSVESAFHGAFGYGLIAPLFHLPEDSAFNGNAPPADVRRANR